MTFELGLVEGRFGRTWGWDDRGHVLHTLADAGYRFYHYGPKGDRHLRRDWRMPHPVAEAEAIARFAADCRRRGVRFGMALTPVGATHPFDAASRADLRRRLADLDAIGIDDLAILFDDLPGDLPGLAAAQGELVAFCQSHSRAGRIYFCPSYYSDDPVLDRAFGRRPPDYLADLGRCLPADVRIYWTGEEVCAREVSVGHVRRVAEAVGRPICLWDNYPVNDGARMSRFLHLRAFTGRPAGLADCLAGHAVNPAIQSHLSCLPALTLAASYAQGDDYRYAAAFATAATRLLGPEFAAMLGEDLIALQDCGHERLGERGVALRRRYGAIDHPAAREICRWLDGGDLMTDDEVRTQ